MTMRTLFVASVLVATVASGSAATVYRCTINGKPVLQDSPCPLMAPGQAQERVDVPAAAPSGSDSVLGDWRGPLQFNFSSGGQRDPKAHNIAPVVLGFNADGTVRGASTDAGCRFLGLARRAAPTVNVWWLDLTAKGCADSRFDQRYSGSLSLYPAEKVAELKITVTRAGLLGGQVQTAELAAQLRR